MGQLFHQSLANWKAAYDQYAAERKTRETPMREGERSIWEIQAERFAKEGREGLLRTLTREAAE